MQKIPFIAIIHQNVGNFEILLIHDVNHRSVLDILTYLSGDLSQMPIQNLNHRIHPKFRSG